MHGDALWDDDAMSWGVPLPRTRLRQLVAVARDEVAGFDRAAVVGRVLSAPIPEGVATRVRTAILRRCGLRIGEGTTIVGRVVVTGGRRSSQHLSIGRECFINVGCQFDATAPIEIGHCVALGQQVLMTTSWHDHSRPERRAGTLEHRSIRVGDGAWISSRAVVLPGVTIGEGAVVCAGAIVARSVAPHTMVGGVPARPIKDLPVDGDRTQATIEASRRA